MPHADEGITSLAGVTLMTRTVLMGGIYEQKEEFGVPEFSAAKDVPQFIALFFASFAVCDAPKKRAEFGGNTARHY